MTTVPYAPLDMVHPREETTRHGQQHITCATLSCSRSWVLVFGSVQTQKQMKQERLRSTVWTANDNDYRGNILIRWLQLNEKVHLPKKKTICSTNFGLACSPDWQHRWTWKEQENCKVLFRLHKNIFLS